MTPEDVYKAIDQLVSFILRYAVTLAAISALAMALIEAVKALFSLRDRFHKRRVRAWILSVPPPVQFFGQLNIVNETPFHQRVYAQLIQLTTGESAGAKAITDAIEWKPWDIGPGNALFALELEKMMGQIQSAADTAVNHPKVYSDLYLFLTMGADAKDITEWFDWSQEPPAHSLQQATLAKDQADAYSRLRQLVRRRLDAFQLVTSYRWQTGNQIASVALGAGLLFGSLAYLAREKPPQTKLQWLGLVVTSLLGGIMAPAAKDLVIALKKTRSNV